MMGRDRDTMTLATQEYIHIVIGFYLVLVYGGNLSSFHCGSKMHNLDPENPLKVNTERLILASAIDL